VPSSIARRLAYAALLAVPVAIGLIFFVESCGAIHGKASCGPASAVAVPIVVIALVFEGLVFTLPQSDATTRVLVWASAYLIALVACLAGLYVASLMRRR
jgi:hypothetical protein